MGYFTGFCPIINAYFRTVFWCPVTSHHGDFRRLSNHLFSEYLSYLFHALVTANRTIETVQVTLFYDCFGKIPASGITATTTVSTGKNRLNKVYVRVFKHLKALGNNK